MGFTMWLFNIDYVFIELPENDYSLLRYEITYISIENFGHIAQRCNYLVLQTFC